MQVVTNSLLDMCRFAKALRNQKANNAKCAVLSYVIAWSLEEDMTKLPEAVVPFYLTLVDVVSNPSKYPKDMKEDD